MKKLKFKRCDFRCVSKPREAHEAAQKVFDEWWTKGCAESANFIAKYLLETCKKIEKINRQYGEHK